MSERHTAGTNAGIHVGPDSLADRVGEVAWVRHHGSLSFEAPSDWFFKESITALAPDGRANVIASSEPLGLAIDSYQYATMQGDLLMTEFPGYHERYFGEVGVVGLPGTVYFREFSWTPESGGSVVQSQLYALVRGRGITATGTTPEEDFDGFRDDLYAQLTSLVHHVAGTPPGGRT